MEPRARCAGFSVAEIGNRKERLRDYASFPGFLPLNPLRTPSPSLKRAGTPCTRERGLRLGLTALRGASEGWGYGVAARCGVRGIRNASLPDSCFFMNRFAIWDYGVTLGCRPNLLGALPQTPARNFVPCTLSSLRGGFKQLNSHGLSRNNLEFNTRLSCVVVDILWKKLYNNKED